jgi:outer membrane protein OmpA-like peptidoglycan-associated protein
MTHLEQQSRREHYRLPGEDVPTGFALAFTLIGTLTAMVAAWLVIGQAPMVGQRSEIEGRQYAPPNPDTKVASVSATGSSAVPSPPISLVEKGPQITAHQPLADANNTPSMPVECPPDVNITFKPGSAGLSRADIEKLEPLRQWLNSHPQAKLLVEGYTDPVGKEQANLILSYRRAKTVAAVLHKSGIPREKMAIRAAGEHQPIPGLPDDAAEYRRANLQIAGSENCQNSSTGRGQ